MATDVYVDAFNLYCGSLSRALAPRTQPRCSWGCASSSISSDRRRVSGRDAGALGSLIQDLGQQTGSKRLKSTSLNHAELNPQTSTKPHE
jgi:hypothetical protein